ncbi:MULTISPECIES: TadE family type IV pilus minor pilin [unclassified Arthrobacter]|uniref:TadE family type IV pilus minor pilin n=1 Tax=unclassified Pseudarthrobacter TaxID=2647000 RepID=UPI003390BB63
MILSPAALQRPNDRSSRRGPGNARGAVTAEFAVALPAVLLLLALLLAGASAGVTQLRLEEAARAGARALARGEDPSAVQGIVRTLAGTSATASVAADGEWLSVTVADGVGGPLGATVPWTLTATATTRGETPAASGDLQPLVLPMPATMNGYLFRLAQSADERTEHIRAPEVEPS